MKVARYLLMMSALVSSCNGEKAGEHLGGGGVGKINYPYRATEDRLRKIRQGSKAVSAGMDRNDVLAKIGLPDEINDTLDKNDLKRKVGFSFVYLEQRDKEVGSVKEKNEKLVRIHFDLKKKVTGVVFVK